MRARSPFAPVCAEKPFVDKRISNGGYGGIAADIIREEHHDFFKKYWIGNLFLASAVLTFQNISHNDGRVDSIQ